MTDCPNCEYHKNRAARWRAEAYAQAGHDIIERPWVGLTDAEIAECFEFIVEEDTQAVKFAHAIEDKLKEKNVSTL
jgi:hypothetical protein